MGRSGIGLVRSSARRIVRTVTVFAVAALAQMSAVAAEDAAWQAAKPRTYWWWFGDTVTTNGITHDLEAMQRLGLGGATICANHWMGLKPGPVKCLSDEWYDCIVWAGKEADRLGLELGFHDCPGWCDTGGPWVRPQYAQKHLVWTESRLTGGKEIDCVLPRAAAPFGIYREVAVIAIPDREEHEVFEGGLRDYVFAAPRIVSSIRLTGEKRDGPLDCFLPQPDFRVLVSDDGATFREHARITTVAAEEILTLTFPAVKAKALRIAAGSGGLPSFRRAEVFATPLLPHATRKSYGRFVWNEQLVPQETFACPAKDAVALDEVVELTDRVDADGRLVWRAPAGKWLVFRFASTVMDKAINHLATPAGTGLECDKLSKEGVEEGARGPVTRIPELAKLHGIRSFRTVFSDSGEAPPPNWTEKMPEEFKALRGYDLRKFLPTMAGRFVGSTSVSERFLRDFRRTVGDLIVRYWGRYYAGLMHTRGLKFEKQAYNWAYNQLEMSEVADIPMGEFWLHTAEGAGETAKLAGMEGDLWGRRIVSAEAFTDACGKVMRADGANEDLDDLRREGDKRLASGVNRLVFHAYTHQPYDDPARRTNYWHFGIRIDRHHPKFDSFIPWVSYLTKTQAQLQRGRGVADAVVLMREEVTLDAADWNIKDPYGYRSNAIERKQFLRELAFRDGRLRLPSGMDYRVLVLPQVEELSPEVLKKVLSLVEAGAEVVLGPRPVGSPSLVGYPACDAEVEALAKKLWDGCPAKGSAQIGEGCVWRGVEMTDVYAAIGLKPDCAVTEGGRPVDAREVVYTHRVDGATNIYFIANVTDRPKRLTVTFRSGETREIVLEGSSSACVEFGDGQMAEDVDIDKLCPPRPETAAKFKAGAYPAAAWPVLGSRIGW